MTRKRVVNYAMNAAEKGDKGCKSAEMWYDRKTSCSECPFPVGQCLEGKSKAFLDGYFQRMAYDEVSRAGIALAMEVK